MTRHRVFLDIETGPGPDEVWEAYARRRDAVTRELAPLSPTLGTVIAIGYAIDDGPIVILDAFDRAQEFDALRALGVALHGLKRNYVLVGHNAKGFDIPFLQARMVIRGLARAVPLLGKPGSKPWELPVEDTFDLFPHPSGSGTPGARSLQVICAALGIPAQSGPLGGDMAACLASGDLDAIRSHLRADVDQVREVYRRLAPALES